MGADALWAAGVACITLAPNRIGEYRFVAVGDTCQASQAFLWFRSSSYEIPLVEAASVAACYSRFGRREPDCIFGYAIFQASRSPRREAYSVLSGADGAVTVPGRFLGWGERLPGSSRAQYTFRF